MMGMQSLASRRALARGLSALLATTVVLSWRPATGSPADLFSSPAPALGADPPKASDLRTGDASVSSQTGAFQYAYPITVPPGRNGMAPTLSLSYSSQGAIYGGVASGWSLPIPMILEDTSVGRLATRAPEVEAQQYGVDYKRDDRFISTMAGGQRLVPVNELATTPSDVFQMFRADGDSSYTRYERMQDSQLFRWRARTTDGNVMEFGDSTLQKGCTFTEQYAPLTRVSDAFGNEITYEWEGSDDDCHIKEITWGQNANAGTAPFAKVVFTYVAVAPCTYAAPAIAVGSYRDYHEGPLRVSGAQRLTTITSTAFPPGQPLAPEHTREITLTYDGVAPASGSEACAQARTPLRQLIKIQESAWRGSEAHVTTPAVEFDYRPATALGTHSSSAMWPAPPAGPSDMATNLAWGYRRLDTRWPTVEAMLVDIDGDGLEDRLTNAAANPAAPLTSCGAYWQRNQGPDANGNPTFGGAAWIDLPRLKWAGETDSPAGSPAARRDEPGSEGCALNGMYTAYRNVNASTGLCHKGGTCTAGLTLPGPFCADGTECPAMVPTGSDPFRTYLAYRWLDMDADGRVDLVAAIHGNTNVYDPEWGNRHDGSGDYTAGEASISGLPAADAWPACPGQADRCKDDNGLGTCLDRARVCENGGECTMSWSAFNACFATVPQRSCFEVMAKPGPGGGPPPTFEIRRPYTRCEGLYPWFIYRNLGAGQFAPEPIIKYQPIPLESDTGDSAMNGPSVVSQHHAIIDLDGDGILDAVAHGKPDGSDTGAAAYYVWLGDGQGGFTPTRYVYPTRFEGAGDPFTTDIPAGNENALSGTGSVGSYPVSEILAKLGLLDVNGDGLVDHWLSPSQGSQPGTNVAFSDGVRQRVFGTSVATATG